MVVAAADTLGETTRIIPLPTVGTLSQRATSLTLGPSGHPIVVVQAVDLDASASWEILDPLLEDSARVLASLQNNDPTMTFQGPLLSSWEGRILSLHPLTHSLSVLQHGHGSFTPKWVRDNPPLWKIPGRHLRDYRRLLGRLGSIMADLSALPPYWPSVRGFTVRRDGSVLLAVTASADRVHIEHLDPAGNPQQRFSSEGFTDQVFLTQGRAFIVQEGWEETSVHEFVF
jgi:hypothetical protein